MATGDNIRRYRKAKGFTQAQLADAVGLTEGAIRHYESGIRAVKPELLEKPWYLEADMTKYLATIINTLNHDVSIGDIMSATDKIQALVKKYNA